MGEKIRDRKKDADETAQQFDPRGEWGHARLFRIESGWLSNVDGMRGFPRMSCDFRVFF